MHYTVEVKDAAGTVVFSTQVALPQRYIDHVQDEYTNHGDRPPSEPEIALLLAAPEFCPYDCDGCHA